MSENQLVTVSLYSGDSALSFSARDISDVLRYSIQHISTGKIAVLKVNLSTNDEQYETADQ